MGRQGVSQEESFESALATAEEQAGATLRAAAAVTRELRKARAAAAGGQTRELRRGLEAAQGLATSLADAVGALRSGFDFDEGEYLASGSYAKELLAMAAARGVDMFEKDERLLCYPSLVRVLPDQAALEIDRRRERRLRPSVVVDLLGAAQRRGPRFRPEPFLDSLRAAYELVIARQGKKADAVVRLVDVWAVLTLLAGQGVHQAGVRPRPVPARPERDHAGPTRRAAAALEREHRHQGRRCAHHGGARGPAAALLGDLLLVAGC